MCGRVVQKGGELPGLVSIMGGPDESRVRKPRFNGAPSQDFWIVRKQPESDVYRRDLMVWDLIPYWLKDEKGGRKPINA